MGIIAELKSYFFSGTSLEHRAAGELLSFRRIWLLSFFLTATFAIIPVLFFALLDYNVTKKSVESEAVLRTARLTANTWRSVSFFLNERKSALKFTVYDHPFEDLDDIQRLALILRHLRLGFGGFTDLGIVNAAGFQKTYAGPYLLEGKDYRNQPWFNEVLASGSYISEVFLGYRNVPHLVIAIKHGLPAGGFFVLRATIEDQFTSLLSQIIPADQGDVFLVNTKGVLQTPSRYFGEVLSNMSMAVPADSDNTRVIDATDSDGTALIVGYRYIPETPFILMVVKKKDKLMAPWRQSNADLIRYLIISITVILLWICAITFFLVRRLELTDRRRIRYYHMAEYANKLASIGRLAAGVAHEVNNPLAVINEKAGFIKDLFTYTDKYEHDPKLLGAVDSIISSVSRCGRITRRLLSFARHMDVSIQSIHLREIVNEVLGFLEKEAQYRSIEVQIDIPADLPDLETDRGKLQQIFLNIFNNSFAAMQDGGQLKISSQQTDADKIQIRCEDNGCGIPASLLENIFEPFFSTKTAVGGTGLGLSITYGLVKELGGEISVQSTVGAGTVFFITLPLKDSREGRNPCASY